jgi:hypothetical protein
MIGSPRPEPASEPLWQAARRIMPANGATNLNFMLSTLFAIAAAVPFPRLDRADSLIRSLSYTKFRFGRKLVASPSDRADLMPGSIL